MSAVGKVVHSRSLVRSACLTFSGEDRHHFQVDAAHLGRYQCCLRRLSERVKDQRLVTHSVESRVR